MIASIPETRGFSRAIGPAPMPLTDRPSLVTLRGVSDHATIEPERELLGRVAQGDREAFAELYDLYSGVLLGTLLRMLNDQAEAEDVLQDTFLLIWENAPRYDGRLGKPFNWALTMARNKAIDRLRASQRRLRLLDQAAPEDGAVATNADPTVDHLVEGERSTAIRQALSLLPAEQRAAIDLAFFGGLTQMEIAEVLGEPLGTVKARIRRGMLKLRELLDPTLRETP